MTPQHGGVMNKVLVMKTATTIIVKNVFEHIFSGVQSPDHTLESTRLWRTLTLGTETAYHLQERNFMARHFQINTNRRTGNALTPLTKSDSL